MTPKKRRIYDKRLKKGFARKKSLKGTRKIESVVGNLYAFSYFGKGARDSFPLILSVRRNGRRKFTAKNGDTYMAGIALNQLSDTVRDMVIQKFYKLRVITYPQIKAVGRAVNIRYRIYNTKLMKNIEVIDPDIYLRR